VIIAVPAILYSSYHIYFMHYVSFDYGYNTTVVIVMGISNSVLWFFWCLFTRHWYIWKNILAQLVIWGMSAFEVFDFPPLFGYIDPHAIWHLGGCLAAILWANFLITDANHFIKRKIEDGFLQFHQPGRLFTLYSNISVF